jgi:hypothetical protein
VTDAGRTVPIEVPELAPSPAPAPPAPLPEPATAARPGAPALPATNGYWTARRIASASLTATGVAGLSVAVGLAFLAKSQDEAASQAVTNRSADSTRAYDLGTVATAVGVAGVAVAAAGVVLWLTAPDAPVRVGADARGVVMSGGF